MVSKHFKTILVELCWTSHLPISTYPASMHSQHDTITINIRINSPKSSLLSEFPCPTTTPTLTDKTSPLPLKNHHLELSQNRGSSPKSSILFQEFLPLSIYMGKLCNIFTNSKNKATPLDMIPILWFQASRHVLHGIKQFGSSFGGISPWFSWFPPRFSQHFGVFLPGFHHHFPSIFRPKLRWKVQPERPGWGFWTAAWPPDTASPLRRPRLDPGDCHLKKTGSELVYMMVLYYFMVNTND